MKWELEKRIVIPAAFLIGILSWVVVSAAGSLWHLEMYEIVAAQVLVIGVTSISLVLWRFFRDPERTTPEKEHAILAPADGRVIYVKEIENGEIPFSEKNGKKFALNEFVQSNVLPSGGHLVGIAMTWLDVHVNRAPIGGKVSLLKHIRGLFISLKKKEAVIRNERALVVIENGHMRVGIVQIASRLVRNIIPYISEGSEIRLGQRIGMIRFGSQVDLVLPAMPSLKIHVKPGEKVTAGESIVATYDMTHHPLP
jgi:phosphatidylserine decarboxylase